MKQIMYRIRKMIALITLMSLIPWHRVNASSLDNENVTDNAVSDNKTTFYITDRDDFMEFYNESFYDDWSVSRNVVLKNDINLYGMIGFTGIPSFSGTFNGNNHTISGLTLNTGTEAVGLFRYMEKGAVVENLNVEGAIASEPGNCYIGGICGVNGGTIKNCTFNGRIDGIGYTGGIAGYNGGYATIDKCQFKGEIDCAHSVGGITGENNGVITDCITQGDVDADNSWFENEENSGNLSVSYTGLVEIGTEKLMAETDIGGIAGVSRGIIAGCENKGNVGYPHTGQNVGGITGRQSGVLIDCHNSGEVYGKQDVGGICGQFEPAIDIDDVDKLSEKVDELHDTVDCLVNNIGDMGDTLNAELDELTTHADKASKAADNCAQEIKTVTSSGIEWANDISGRADYISDRIPTVLSYIEATNKSMREVSDRLDDIPEDMEIEYSSKDKDKLKAARDEMNSGIDSFTNAMDAMNNAAQGIEDILVDDSGNVRRFDELENDDIEALQQLFLDYIEYMADAGEAAALIIENADIIADITESYIKESVNDIADDIDKAEDAMDKLLDSLDKTEAEIRSITDYINALSDVKMTNFTKEYDENAAILSDEITTMIDIMDRINDDTHSYSESIEAQLSLANDEINDILNTMIVWMENLDDIRSGEDIVKDVSKEVALHSVSENTAECDYEASYIIECSNNGIVNGNINVGGISGCISRDGSESVRSGDFANADINLGAKYTAAAIIDKCNNDGYVTVKNENGGGIAGCISVGFVGDTCSAGYIEGEGAVVIGGIAGLSEGAIYNCKSIANLTGKRYIGGIAGKATEICGCLSMPRITSENGMVGAIAGAFAKDDTCDDESMVRIDLRNKYRENYFVSKKLAGIDGVNYKSVAEPVEYEDITSMQSAGNYFDEFDIIFIDENDKELQRITLPYDSGIANIELPYIETMDGDYYEWVGFDTDRLESNMIIKARPTANVTVITSNQTVKNRTDCYAEGVFTESAELISEIIDAETLKNMGKLPSDIEDEYVVREIRIVNGKLDNDDKTKIRILNENAKMPKVYLYQGGRWVRTEAVQYGDYTELSITGNSAVVLLGTENAEKNRLLVIAGASVGFILLITCFIFVKKKRK